MALLSAMMRTTAFTGRTDSTFSRIAGRQGAQWAEGTVRGAYPTSAPRPYGAPADPAASMRALTDLRERGVVTDAEFDRLRSELQQR